MILISLKKVIGELGSLGGFQSKQTNKQTNKHNKEKEMSEDNPAQEAPKNDNSGTGTMAGPVPFDISKTLMFQAVEHWAELVPDRTALIYTDTAWKVKKGRLERSIDPSEWRRVTYKDFNDRIRKMRAALYSAGVPTKPKPGGYRIIILYMPQSRIDFMAMIFALQATGCVPLFARPKAMGGLRPWARMMLSLQPDAILCTRLVRFIFRSIAATSKRSQTTTTNTKNNNNNNNNNSNGSMAQLSPPP